MQYLQEGIYHFQCSVLKFSSRVVFFCNTCLELVYIQLMVIDLPWSSFRVMISTLDTSPNLLNWFCKSVSEMPCPRPPTNRRFISLLAFMNTGHLSGKVILCRDHLRAFHKCNTTLSPETSVPIWSYGTTPRYLYSSDFINGNFTKALHSYSQWTLWNCTHLHRAHIHIYIHPDIFSVYNTTTDTLSYPFHFLFHSIGCSRPPTPWFVCIFIFNRYWQNSKSKAKTISILELHSHNRDKVCSYNSIA